MPTYDEMPDVMTIEEMDALDGQTKPQSQPMNSGEAPDVMTVEEMNRVSPYIPPPSEVAPEEKKTSIMGDEPFRFKTPEYALPSGDGVISRIARWVAKKPEQMSNLILDLGRGLAEPAVKTLATGASALAAGGALAQEKIFGIDNGNQAQEILNEGINVPLYGKVKPVGAQSGLSQEGTLDDFTQILGTGLQLGTTLGAGELAGAVPKVGKLAAAKVGGVIGALTGGLYGGGAGLRSEEGKVENTIAGTLGGAFLGGVLGAGLSAWHAKTSEADRSLMNKLGLSKRDPQIETLINEKVSPEAQAKIKGELGKYVDSAKEAVKNPRAPSPLELAAKKAEKAFDWYDEKLSEVGQAKTDALAAVGDRSIEDIGSVKQDLTKQVQDRFGVSIKWSKADEDWVIGSVKGRKSSLTDADKGLVLKLWKQINDLSSEGATLREADDTVDLLQNELYGARKNLMAPVSDRVEGLFKQMTGKLNGVVKEQAGPEYMKANAEYARMIEIRDWLNKNLGQEGSKGGSLLKRIFSPSDAGTKAMFEKIRQDTGQDLIKEASLAKFAMETAGDARQRMLLDGLSIPTLKSHLRDKALMIALGALAPASLAGAFKWLK